jgi:hypothetical protein
MQKLKLGQSPVENYLGMGPEGDHHRIPIQIPCTPGEMIKDKAVPGVHPIKNPDGGYRLFQ